MMDMQHSSRNRLLNQHSRPAEKERKIYMLSMGTIMEITEFIRRITERLFVSLSVARIDPKIMIWAGVRLIPSHIELSM